MKCTIVHIIYEEIHDTKTCDNMANLRGDDIQVRQCLHVWPARCVKFAERLIQIVPVHLQDLSTPRGFSHPIMLMYSLTTLAATACQTDTFDWA